MLFLILTDSDNHRHEKPKKNIPGPGVKPLLHRSMNKIMKAPGTMVI